MKVFHDQKIKYLIDHHRMLMIEVNNHIYDRFYLPRFWDYWQELVVQLTKRNINLSIQQEHQSLFMSQFTLISTINLHIFTLFVVLIILANNPKISANSIYRKYDYLPQPLIFDDDQSNILSPDHEIPSSNSWTEILRPRNTPTIPNYNLRHGVIHFIPYKKRTIPLELQKALYAHGIVGRRR